MQLISNHGRPWLRWLPAFSFAVAIFLFSATPGATVTSSLDNLTATVQAASPSTSGTPAPLLEIEWLKVGHAIGYFGLGISVLYALLHSRNSAATAMLLCCFYSVTDELHQSFVPGRSASGHDILLDSLAALAGILVLLSIAKWRKSRQA